MELLLHRLELPREEFLEFFVDPRCARQFLLTEPESDRHVPGRGDLADGEIPHLLPGLLPAGPRGRAEHAVVLESAGVVDHRHHRFAVEDQRGRPQRGARVGELLASVVFLVADEPVVAFRERPPRPVTLVEIVVGLEEPPVLQFLVGAADLLPDEPAHPALQPRLALVVADPLAEELDPLHHPGIAIVVVVELDRDVVREVVGLEVPHGIEVRLELRHLLERGREIRPILHLFVVVGPVPEERHSDVLEPERRQTDRLARGIDIAEIRLGEPELLPQLGELPPLTR